MKLVSSKYLPLIDAYDWDTTTALAVMAAESNGQADAKNTNIRDWHDGFSPEHRPDLNYNNVKPYPFILEDSSGFLCDQSGRRLETTLGHIHRDRDIYQNITNPEGVVVKAVDFFKVTNKGAWRGSYGLFQVGGFVSCRDKRGNPLYIYHIIDITQLFIPEVNIRIAHKIWQEGGKTFKRWGAYTHPKGSPRYLAYMDDARLDYEEYRARLSINGGLKNPTPIPPTAPTVQPSTTYPAPSPVLTTNLAPTRPHPAPTSPHKIAADVVGYGADSGSKWLEGKYGKGLDVGQRYLKVLGLGGVGLGTLVHSAGDSVVNWSDKHIKLGESSVQVKHFIWVLAAISVGLLVKWLYARVKSGRAGRLEKVISGWFAWKMRGAKLGKLEKFK